jgi:hypothetical protein
MFITTSLMGTLRRRAVASMIRWLAWWGTTRSMSPGSRPERRIASRLEAAMAVTAPLKTSRPSMTM